MKFLVDNQRPVALAKYLIAKGHEAEHVLDAGLAEAKDQDICHYATKHSLVIVTKDEDFSLQAAQVGAVIQVVWVRLGNCRKAALLAAFDSLHASIIASLGQGERLIEIR